LARTITIVGGGLAGLTLGIGLREQGIPVVLCEAGGYPRHRVCGEFINGRGYGTLARLGLLKLLERNGAREARTAAFFSRRKSLGIRTLPQPALCLSRFVLDKLWAEHFASLGGDLRTGWRWRAEGFGAGVVRANGRQAQTLGEEWHWFGLKGHAQNVALSADLEMHFFPNSYVGLCRIEEDKVNVCGLLRRSKAKPSTPENFVDRLRGPYGSILSHRLAKAQWDAASFCAVAGLSFRPLKAGTTGECRLGDALTMIAPFTGNGMSMAFESAEIAISPLAAYARQEIQWSDAQRAIAEECDVRFTRRLRWSSWFQNGLFRSPARIPLLPIAIRCGWIWRWLFFVTR